MTDISNDDDKTYTIAITQLDYHEDATRVKELVKDYVDNDLDFLWYNIGEQIDEKEQFFWIIRIYSKWNFSWICIFMVENIKQLKNKKF
ncbi:MAG: hypothetical protein OHM56_08410 [Spiroplasma phoeniceum]|nr:MAG: hypothetical protein OHM57_07815 [Spiroplasma phoeniceum]UZQ31635.1 MAG: hypothetical protein OHM56_08410 [Spiroplasma phoeniceum]